MRLALGALVLGALVALGALGLWALEGSPRTPPRDLGSAVLVATTLITTVGYGSGAPRSPAGRAFCSAYVALGVPVAMVVLAGAARRLAEPVVHRPRRHLRARWGFSRRGAARLHFAALVALAALLLVLLPAAAFSALEGAWTYLDAVYFCVVSLCTVGLGDLVAAEAPQQPLRQLYQVAVAAYLLLGVTAALLLAQTFHGLAELHGLPGSSAASAEEEPDGLLEGTRDEEKPPRERGGAGAQG
ncbi:potassium channel subfamily K member 6 [Cuculus canorus]|uniref:potassium channel subfamily K member 6 n=1 Tax=Cuculus canorus TaxID=55661 RepID=UPI0023AA8DD0|nr:potassium channel subfamily K member 6 [Cuculus canorus]